VRGRYLLLALLGLALGLAIPALLGGRALGPVLAQIRLWHLLALLGLIVLAWNLNAGRLRLLLGGIDGRRITQRQALGVVMASEFAISATPGGAGGPVTYAYLLRRHGLPVPQGLALYTIDQLLDMLFFLMALLAFAVYDLWLPEGARLAWQILLLIGLLLCGAGVVVAIVRRYRRFVLFAGRGLRRLGIRPSTRRKLMRRLLEYRQGLLRIRHYSPWRLMAVYGLCAGHWLLRYSVLYFAIREVGGRVDWLHAFLVQMISLSLGHAILLPGGSGGAEASATLLLLPWLDPGRLAGAILIWRFVTFYWYLIAGAPVFLVLVGRNLWSHWRADEVPS